MDISALTHKQSEVFELLIQGLGNGEIANALGMAEKTVKTHVTAIFRATGCGQRSQVIARYYMDREELAVAGTAA